MYLKPVSGRQVPDPDRGDLLPAEGREVADQQYWHRRLQDGDVEISTAPGVSPAAKISKGVSDDRVL